jgi:phosphopantothenoylcysteine decarboxylase/phosphopantothenate--cysteine ligase
VRLGREADLVVVAPATADVLARAAAGMANDLLTATLLTARCPVLLAPAMHTEMWEHPATRANVALLRERGVVVLDPDSGRLTGADSGAGRLPEPEAIHAAATALLGGGGGGGRAGAGTPRGAAVQDLAGRRVVVSAGGTREPLDPVRFLGNSSTGRQGVALAVRALARGAAVTLVAAHTEVALPDGADVVRVSTAAQLHDAVLDAAAGADAVVMAAAVADFRPARTAQFKMKKSDEGDDAPVVQLVRNPDVLADLVAARRRGALSGSTVLVGFAAETGDADHTVLEHGRAKLARKGPDLLVVNEVGGGRGFGTPDNTVVILSATTTGGPDGVPTGPPTDPPTIGPASKEDVADAVWDAVLARTAAVKAPEALGEQ